MADIKHFEKLLADYRHALLSNDADRLRRSEAAYQALLAFATGVKATAPARQFTDAEIEAWAERHDIAGNEAQLRVIFDDARSLVPAGVKACGGASHE